MTLQRDVPLVSSDSASVARRFSCVVAAHGERPALVTAGRQWSYRALDAAADEVAADLGRLCGDAPGPVAIAMHQGAPAVIGMLAALKTGRPYVALGGAGRDERGAAVVAASGAVAVLREADVSVGCGVRVERVAGDVKATRYAWEGAACILYSTGTTGRPKGVILSHAVLAARTDAYTSLAGIGHADRVGWIHPPATAASVSSIWGALLCGASLYPFVPQQMGFGALGEWILASELTVLHCVPTVFRRLVRSSPESLRSLRLLRLGGETILPEDVARFRAHTKDGCRLCVALSSAESGPVAMRLYSHGDDFSERRVALGRPMAGVVARVVNDAGQPVARGEVGRLRISGAHLAEAVWDGEAVRALAQEGEGFDTRDLVRVTAAGEMEHCGRADDQVKIAGHRVNPGELEAALLRTAGVEQAAVVAHGGGNGEMELVAFITGKHLPAERVLLRTLTKTLPAALLPAGVIRLEALPTTAGAKIDRRALAALPWPAREEARGPKTRDPVEKRLAAIFSRALGRAVEDRRADFFADLGGSSLQALEVLTAIAAQFDQRLGADALLAAPTIEGLAQRLAAEVYGLRRAPSLMKAGSGLPLFLFHPGNGGVFGYRALVGELAAGQCVYGISCAGMLGEAWPLRTIGAMARAYAGQIERAESREPYFLAGTCMGGLIALETARELTARGRRVAFVGLLNTTDPHAAGPRVGRVGRRRVTDSVAQWFRVVRWGSVWAADRATGGRFGLTRGAGYRRFVALVNTAARRGVTLRPYAGHVDIFTAAEDAAEMERRLAVGRVAGGVTVHVVAAGEHFLSPPAEGLVAALQGRLDALAAKAV